MVKDHHPDVSRSLGFHMKKRGYACPRHLVDLADNLLASPGGPREEIRSLNAVRGYVETLFIFFIHYLGE